MNIALTVWDNFRERQFLLGIEVPETAEFKYDAATLTPAQREKLLKTGQALNDPCILMEPGKDPGSNRVAYVPWKADLNPRNMQPVHVLEAWEADFDERTKHLLERYALTV